MSQLPYRNEIAARLCEVLPGRNLHDLAAEFSVRVRFGDKLNKGWAGQTIERAAGLAVGGIGPDGADFELKSTTLVDRRGEWVPKETIKIVQLNPRQILEETFETSALWQKLSRLVVVGVHHASPDDCRVVRVSTFDLSDPNLREEIARDWADIKLDVASGEIADYSSLGTSDGLLQLRSVGTKSQISHCPVTGRVFPALAFYGTKRLVRATLGL